MAPAFNLASITITMGILIFCGIFAIINQMNIEGISYYISDTGDRIQGPIPEMQENNMTVERLDAIIKPINVSTNNPEQQQAQSGFDATMWALDTIKNMVDFKSYLIVWGVPNIIANFLQGIAIANYGFDLILLLRWFLGIR